MPGKAADLHEGAIVVAGHTDIAACDVDWRRVSGETRILDRRHLPTLRAGGVTVICDHVGGDAHYGYLPATRLYTNPLQRFMRALDHAVTDLEESDGFILATTVDDIHRAKRDGKVAFVICMEGAGPLEEEIGYLRNFYRLGLRCLGLTHDLRNGVADGIRERSGSGLTHFGVQVVEECNRLGIVIDVSHLSDRGVWDVLEISKAPVTASHSNCRALCSSLRNLTDDMIKGIAASGGVIGVHALDYLVGDRPRPSFDMLIAHIERLVKLGGIDCVGLGPDILENCDTEMYTRVSERSRRIGGVPTFELNFTYPDGMRSLADLPNVTDALLKLGFGEPDIAKFLGGNWMRVFEHVWKPSAGPR
ncbi:MAG: dipeptidase [Alphaproteobacteria bacterium]|nr:dipeptidase [Alphaproteobacteria bacterium]